MKHLTTYERYNYSNKVLLTLSDDDAKNIYELLLSDGFFDSINENFLNTLWSDIKSKAVDKWKDFKEWTQEKIESISKWIKDKFITALNSNPKKLEDFKNKLKSSIPGIEKMSVDQIKNKIQPIIENSFVKKQEPVKENATEVYNKLMNLVLSSISLIIGGGTGYFTFAVGAAASHAAATAAGASAATAMGVVPTAFLTTIGISVGAGLFTTVLVAGVLFLVCKVLFPVTVKDKPATPAAPAPVPAPVTPTPAAPAPAPAAPAKAQATI